MTVHEFLNGRRIQDLKSDEIKDAKARFGIAEKASHDEAKALLASMLMEELDKREADVSAREAEVKELSLSPAFQHPILRPVNAFVFALAKRDISVATIGGMVRIHKGKILSSQQYPDLESWLKAKRYPDLEQVKD